MMKQVYGDDTVSLKTLCTWFKKFIDGRESVEDKYRSGRPTKGDHALRYNTRLVKRFLPQHGVTELSPPPPPSQYSLDLSLPDFFLFPKLKVALKGRRFTDIMHIEAAVTRQLKAVSVEEYSRTFDDLYTRCQKCKVYDGDYFDY
ncbi:hypothetical protein AVEN_152997-1 [Araneus ventricosus]|uniref:Mos1 transposase HTH domain-containing protein n=1 Tax=Araneus ventricosus TaxID=182803 RepID=A0A4Y2AEQ6_ARAVE|nr:hypothetical protein AVEN_152997-1 [Araneus ventricosus]